MVGDVGWGGRLGFGSVFRVVFGWEGGIKCGLVFGSLVVFGELDVNCIFFLLLVF